MVSSKEQIYRWVKGLTEMFHYIHLDGQLLSCPALAADLSDDASITEPLPAFDAAELTDDNPLFCD